MRKFKDREGTEWELTIDMSSAMALKTEVGVDILEIAEGKDLVQLSGDLLVLGGALWTLVADQAKALNLDDKAFFRRLNGDALEAATEALVAECFDFFPSEKRALLKSAFEKIRSVEKNGIQKAMKTLQETTDEEFETLVTGFVRDLKRPGESPLNPGSSLSAS